MLLVQCLSTFAFIIPRWEISALRKIKCAKLTNTLKALELTFSNQSWSNFFFPHLFESSFASVCIHNKLARSLLF